MSDSVDMTLEQVIYSVNEIRKELQIRRSKHGSSHNNLRDCDNRANVYGGMATRRIKEGLIKIR